MREHQSEIVEMAVALDVDLLARRLAASDEDRLQYPASWNVLDTSDVSARQDVPQPECAGRRNLCRLSLLKTPSRDN
jgi:hypothetical protein